MAVDMLRRWAAGTEDEGVEEGEEDSTTGELEVELWSGGEFRTDEELAAMEPEEAEALAFWFGESEPEIWAAMHAIVEAEGDEESRAAALAQLASATQYLVPEYPDFDQEQRDRAAEKLAELAGGDLAGDRAILVALAHARRDVAGDDLGEDDELEDEEDELGDEEDEALELEDG